MNIIIFLYYMIYTLLNKMGIFSYKTSPFTVDANDKKALERVNILVTNGAGAIFTFWLLLLSINIYIWLPQIGLSYVKDYLLSFLDTDVIIICILALLSAISYLIIFHNNRYARYFEKFKKMGCLFTLIYSIVGLLLFISPIILLFAAI